MGWPVGAVTSPLISMTDTSPFGRIEISWALAMQGAPPPRSLFLEMDDHLDDVPFRSGLERHLIHQALDEEDAPATRVALPLDLAVDVGRRNPSDPGPFVLHGDLETALVDRETDADLHARVQLISVLDGVRADR